MAGEKVTEMVQLAPAASDGPQLLVSLNRPISGELGAVMPVMVNGALPVLLSVTVCAAEVVPAVAEKLSDEGESEATGRGAAVPVPLRLIICGETAALSVTSRLPVTLPAMAGEKVTEMVQLAPAPSDGPQLLVSLNRPISGELGAVMPVMVNGALPVLLSVTVCAAEVVPAVAEKLSDEGESEATGRGAAVPVPLRLIICGEPVALSVTRMLPVTPPVVTGAKVTEMAQLVPAASDAPQLLVSLNRPTRGELGAEMPVMVSGTLPVLLSVTVCAAEVVPAAAEKLRDEGVSTATGAEAAVPEPLSATVCGEPLALSETARAAL
jgi:sorbitol-specific phosphotransferase system component IIC